MATVGELIISLRASTASFASDLGKASQLSFNTSKEIERSFKRIGTAVTAAIATAATATVAFTAKSIEMADAAGKSAQALGLSVEQFTGLSYAAKISNVDVGQLTGAITIMARNLDKANQATNQGKAAHSALATLFRGNIPAFKSTDEAFLGIAQRLSELPPGLQKVGLATQIFGRGALALIPLLDEGADGIERLRDRALELGVVITGKTAAAADKFNDTLEDLRVIVQGFGLKLAEALLPFMQTLANLMVESGQNAVAFNNNIQALITSVKIMATVVVGLAGALNVAGNEAANLFLLSPLGNVLGPALLGFKGYLAAVRSSLTDTKNAALDTGKWLAAIWDTPTQKAKTFEETMDSLSEALHKVGRPLSIGIGGLADIDEEAAKKIKAFIDNLKEGIAEFGKSDAAITRYKLGLLDASEAEKAFGVSLTHRLELMKLATQALPVPPSTKLFQSPFIGTDIPAPEINLPEIDIDLETIGSLNTLNAKMREQAKILNAENKPAIEQYIDSMAILNEMYLNAGLSSEAFTAEAAKLKEQLEGSQPIVLAVKQSLSEMFSQAIFRAGSLREAFGNVLQRLAEVIFQVKVLDPLLKNLGSGGGGGGGVLGFFGNLIGRLFGGFGGGAASPFNPSTYSFANQLFPGSGGIPFLASGGSLAAGMPAIIGEHGPELFIPSRSGTVVPNGGGGVVVNQYFDARGADAGVEERLRKVAREIHDSAVNHAVRTVYENQRRTG